MSVLSRPVLHRATAPTQREVRIPLPRDGSPAEAVPRTSPAVRTPAPRTAAPTARRRIPPALLALGLAGALGVAGGATYLLTDDGGGSASTVIAPAFVPSFADEAKDRAAAARGNAAPPAVNDALTPGQAQSGQDVPPPFFVG